MRSRRDKTRGQRRHEEVMPEDACVILLAIKTCQHQHSRRFWKYLASPIDPMLCIGDAALSITPTRCRPSDRVRGIANEPPKDDKALAHTRDVEVNSHHRCDPATCSRQHGSYSAVGLGTRRWVRCTCASADTSITSEASRMMHESRLIARHTLVSSNS